MPHSPPRSDTPTPPFWKSRNGVVLMMLLAIALFYLAREHYGHISQFLPYLILLLCPLMHLFGHHHGGHRHQQGESDSSKHEPRE